MGARETALNALIACRKEGAWSNGVLKEYIRRDRLDNRDAALASRLCYGVLQNRQKLDFYLKQLLTGKQNRLHPVVRDILHLGLYQMLEMTKIPVSAAVNESVELTKKYCPNPVAAKLVNGVLRNADRRKGTLEEPVKLSDRYSHPESLIQLLRSYVGEELLEPMLRANNEAPDITIQVNTLKTDAETLTRALETQGVIAQPHSWMENCLVLRSTGALENLEVFRQGHFYVQDPAAKLSVLCAQLPQREDFYLLDCCAAPGGKSFASAIAMEGSGSITSCDVHPHKAELIASGAKRLGIEILSARCQDATEFVADWEGKMDTVIADVPCSGLGIIRKKPDIRYKNLQEMSQLPALQLKILKNQARYVRPGGVLLYSTCTLVHGENEGVVEAFLKENPEYSLEKLPLPAIFPENTTGMLALVPGEYDTDGFFIAKLRRNK